MYKGIYEKNQFGIYDNNFRKLRIHQKGLRDHNILCQKCDNDILGSKLEKYGYHCLSGGISPHYEKLKITKGISPDGIESIIFQNIEYKSFKLFLLSILWRSSITKLDEFIDVNLGPHEEIIRKMVLYDNACDEHDYPITIIKADINSRIPINFIATPRKIKFEGNVSYLFFINEAFYLFNISKYNPHSIFGKGTVKKTNTIEIPILKGPILDDFLKSILHIHQTK